MREYITKLTDRNLQRKKSTGITNYVMYSLIVVILFKISNMLSEVNYELDFWIYIKLFWYSFNFSIGGYFIYFSYYLSISNASSIRVRKYSKVSDSYFTKIVATLIFILPVIPAGFIIWNDFLNDNLSYTVFELFLIFLNTISVILLLVLWFSNKTDHFDIIKQTKKQKDIKTSVFMLLTSTFAMISSFSLLIQLEGISYIDKSNLFVICILFFAVLLIFERIIESHKEDIFARDLENLEYEIYVKNLSDIEIRENLQQNYMGFLIVDWIKFKEKEIKTKIEYFKKEANKINLMKDELGEIDKQKYPIEIEGRKKEIKSKEAILFKNKNEYFEKNIGELQEIINKDSSLTRTDLDSLKELLLQFNSLEKK